MIKLLKLMKKLLKYYLTIILKIERSLTSLKIPDFPHNINCRTINLSKSFLGKIVKLYFKNPY